MPRRKFKDAVVTAPLNLREEPSLMAPKRCIMGKDEKIKVASCKVKGWCFVQFMDITGYAMRDWIEITEE